MSVLSKLRGFLFKNEVDADIAGDCQWDTLAKFLGIDS